MFTYQVIGTLTLHDAGFFGGVRLWVNRPITSVWSTSEAVNAARVVACQEEGTDPEMAVWSKDLQVIPIGKYSERERVIMRRNQ